MIRSSKFICVLDTCVLHPLHVRDLLFWFAAHQLYKPKWSHHIFDEWRILLERQGLSEDKRRKRISFAEKAFPDALVENYEAIIPTLSELPDEKDRHVVAAAIKTNANLIVTNNLKHFPNDYLQQFGLYAKGADDFLADMIDLHPETAVSAFRDMVIGRKNPPIDIYEMLDILRNNGLVQTANYLHSQI